MGAGCKLSGVTWQPGRGTRGSWRPGRAWQLPTGAEGAGPRRFGRPRLLAHLGQAQDPLGDGAGRRLGQGLAEVGRRTLGVAVEHPAEEGLLVAEGGVEAGAVDAHGPGQLGQRRALVTLAPEHLERAVQGFVDVKLPRAPL